MMIVLKLVKFLTIAVILIQQNSPCIVHIFMPFSSPPQSQNCPRQGADLRGGGCWSAGAGRRCDGEGTPGGGRDPGPGGTGVRWRHAHSVSHTERGGNVDFYF